MSLPPQQAAPWHRFSNIRAGLGTVSFLSPSDAAELPDIVGAAQQEGTHLSTIGSGTNLIGSDEEDKSLCLILLKRLDRLDYLGDGLFRAQPGIPLRTFVQHALEHGYGGLAALSGIPGSLGGALAMNAGANGAAISDCVQEIRGIDLASGQPWRWKTGDGGWGYRSSPVPRTVAVTAALIKLAPVEKTAEAAAISAEAERRRRVTPPGLSCGSVFRNPDVAPAGKLLEEAGCKGMVSGPFTVSPKHANWIVNPSGKPGREADCLALVHRMQDAVQNAFGLALKLEWRVMAPGRLES